MLAGSSEEANTGPSLSTSCLELECDVGDHRHQDQSQAPEGTVNRRWDLLPLLLPARQQISRFKPLQAGVFCFLALSAFLGSAVTSPHMEHTAPTPCTEQVLHQRLLVHIQPGSLLCDLHGKASLCQNWPQTVPQPQSALLDQAGTISMCHWSQERESKVCYSNKQPWPKS